VSASPGKHDIEVATDTLRAESGLWLDQCDALHTAAGKAEQLRMDRLEFGMFQLVVADYHAVVDQITARCQEGTQRMTEIASTLRRVADTYDAEEQKNLHQLRHLF
jgi:hypothetical protein